MEWHIITGSKGGVGKTLLTLLLLSYHLEKEIKGETSLVLDLNAMNADTSAMLLYGKKVMQSKAVKLGKRSIFIQKTYSQNSTFLVASPSNPFLLYGYKQFFSLISDIRKYVDDISSDLNVPPIRRVIIDTNYHFCNLFPPQDEHYDEFKSSIQNDTITVWFLWVYRQLHKILEKHDNNEIKIINSTIGAIERVFEQDKIAPFVHTYTPVGLLPSYIEPSNLFARWLGNVARKDSDIMIDHLISLERLEEIGDYVKFQEWMEQLQRAKIQTEASDTNNLQEDDTHQLFSSILYRAILGDDKFEGLGDNLLPINIFPLSIYQPALEGYTDRERADAVADLRKLETYTNFRRLLDRKYGEYS